MFLLGSLVIAPGFFMLLSGDVLETIFGIIYFAIIWHFPKRFWRRYYASCMRINKKLLGV